MKDMLRTLGKLDPASCRKAPTSPWSRPARGLTDVQKATLGDTAGRDRLARDHRQPAASSRWSSSATSCSTPCPIRQFVKIAGPMAGARGRPRRRWRACASSPAPARSIRPCCQPMPRRRRDGAIVEVAPARTALMEAIAERIAGHGGAGLFIDYGHLQSGVGDTLQAVRRHIATKTCWTIPARPISPRMSTSPRLRQAPRAHGLDAHLVDAGRLPARHGPSRARRPRSAPMPTRRRANDCRARSSALPAPMRWARCSRCWRSRRAGVRLPPFAALRLTCTPALPHCRAPERGSERRAREAS